MAIEMIFFDLDGTLLPMDQDVFTKAYFKLLTKKLTANGYDPASLVEAIWTGTAAMVKNNGQRLNEAAFWQKFAEIYGEKVFRDKPIFDEFYTNEFQETKNYCGYTPAAKETVEKLKAKGYRVALATNPIFPATATESRIRWAGLEAEHFEIYTTYENIGYSKPNPEYYRKIAKKVGCAPEECLMVGNDVNDDMVAATIGMQVFLLTDCLINKEEKDISAYPRGSFADLQIYIENRK